MTIGPNIRTARLAAKLTQQQAAELAGTTQNHWSEHETGKKTPDVKTLKRIRDALKVAVPKVTMDWLVDEH